MKYLKCWEKKIHQPSSLYLVKLSFKSEKEIKSFSDKQKFGDFVTSRTALQEMLKEALQREENKIGQIVPHKYILQMHV